jgi:hypothetical protein
MKKLNCTLVIAITGFFLFGCEETKNPFEYLPAQKQAASSTEKSSLQRLVSTDITLAGFQVHYNGRTFDGSQTTFSYTVSGPAVDMHFRLELPSCAPAFSALSPSNGTTTNNDPNINPGVEWHPSTGTGPYAFSITYPGSVREGIVLVSVKSTSTTEVGQIAGACARVFDIAGTVFTDANANGLLEGNETGIANVTVNLLDADNMVVGIVATNGSGFYLFAAFPAGTYTVKVDETSAVLTSTTYLGTTTPTSTSVTVGPDATGNNFGFEPKTSQLVNDLKFGTLSTNGKSASYWAKQLQVAISGKGKADYSKATMQAFVVQIRGLLLPDPYLLPNGDGLQDALNILSKPTKTELDKLNRELLAAEFNHFAGLGIIGTDAPLQLVLLGWGESMVLNNSATAASKAAARSATIAASTLSEAVDLFTALNSSGGGGGGGGPR